MPFSNRRAVIAALVVLTLIAVAVMVLRWHFPDRPAAPRPPVSTAPQPTWSSSPPAPDPGVDMAWAYIDGIEGFVDSGGGAALRDIGDLAVPALVQDYLHRGDYTTDTPPTGDDRDHLYGALHGNADDIDWLNRQGGGRDTAMGRVIDVCALHDTALHPVRMTAVETARLGACVREGAVAGVEWSYWVLDEMRASGGIGDVRGSDQARNLAQVNAVELIDGRYRAGCLAVGAYWSAAILIDFPVGRGSVEYPEDGGRAYALAVCRDTARTAFPPDMQLAPSDPAAPEVTVTA